MTSKDKKESGDRGKKERRKGMRKEIQNTDAYSNFLKTECPKEAG